MSLIISIEDTNLINKISKNNKPYSQQVAYAHVTNPDGSPKRYPEEIKLFCQRDARGNSVAYPKGEYELAPQSIQVERGNLVIKFPELKPVKK